MEEKRLGRADCHLAWQKVTIVSIQVFQSSVHILDAYKLRLELSKAVDGVAIGRSVAQLAWFVHVVHLTESDLAQKEIPSLGLKSRLSHCLGHSTGGAICEVYALSVSECYIVALRRRHLNALSQYGRETGHRHCMPQEELVVETFSEGEETQSLAGFRELEQV